MTVWSATGHGSGFLVDSSGLIATNEHVIGTSEYAAVQLSPTVKVSARIVVANANKDVAILAVNPSFEGIRPVRLGYARDGKPPAVEGQQVFTIGSPLNQRKVMTSGIVGRVEPRAIISDVNINHGRVVRSLQWMDWRLASRRSAISRPLVALAFRGLFVSTKPARKSREPRARLREQLACNPASGGALAGVSAGCVEGDGRVPGGKTERLSAWHE